MRACKKQQEIASHTRNSNTSNHIRSLEIDLCLLQIKCRGRGEVPEPEVVNQFCFEVHKFKAEERQTGLPPRHILVHCTHGYNRTGRASLSAVISPLESLEDLDLLFSVQCRIPCWCV